MRAMNRGSPVAGAATTSRYGRSKRTWGGSTRAELACMPTAVAAEATVPFSPMSRVAACSTRPMQQACFDRPVKSADWVNATPMPRLDRTGFRLAWVARLTFGKATLLFSSPAPPAARREVMAVRAAAAGSAQPAVPAGGSRASMASLPPRYGSQTAVQPFTLTALYEPLIMKCAWTRRPAAVVKESGTVSLGSNGVAQAAFM